MYVLLRKWLPQGMVYSEATPKFMSWERHISIMDRRAYGGSGMCSGEDLCGERRVKVYREPPVKNESRESGPVKRRVTCFDREIDDKSPQSEFDWEEEMDY